MGSNPSMREAFTTSLHRGWFSYKLRQSSDTTSS